jgi:hypothetical protein
MAPGKADGTEKETLRRRKPRKVCGFIYGLTHHIWNTSLTREKSPEMEVNQEEKVHQESHLKEAEKAQDQ